MNRLRYAFAANFIRVNNCESVGDLGCGPLRLFVDYLRHNSELRYYRGVDFSMEELRRGLHQVSPRTADYLCKRMTDMVVEVYHGDLLAADCDKTTVDSRLCDLDCVTLIEVQFFHIMRNIFS